MLSFCTVKYKFRPFFAMINLFFRQFGIKEQIKKYIALQVRIPLVDCFLYGRKRVSFSASVTVEAALAVPLFLFAGVILMMPFQILNVERQVQAHVEMVGEKMSQMSYVDAGTIAESDFLTTAAAIGYADMAVRTKLKDLPIDRISLMSSRFLQDGETVDLVVDYEMKLPFSVFGLESVARRARCYRRAWVGRDGSSGLNEDGSLREEIVYVGRDSTRYHTSKQCHYLSNELQTIRFEQIDDSRNILGKRYRPCSRCGDKKPAYSGMIVYIMNAGESYHTTRTCSSIRSYATAVLKSQVVHLGECSYCSRGY